MIKSNLRESEIVNVTTSVVSDVITRYDATIDVKGVKQFDMWLEHDRTTGDMDVFYTGDFDTPEEFEAFCFARALLIRHVENGVLKERWRAGEIDLRTLLDRLLGYECEEDTTDDDRPHGLNISPEELEPLMDPNAPQQN